MYLGGNVRVTYAQGYYVPQNKADDGENWQAVSVDKDSDAGKAVRDEVHENEMHRRGEEARLAKLEQEKEVIHEKNEKLFAEALEAAKDADAVIFVGGLNHEYDVEGLRSDRCTQNWCKTNHTQNRKPA